jgi:hypothetical protein
MELGDILGYVFYVIDALQLRPFIVGFMVISIAASMVRQMRQ